MKRETGLIFSSHVSSPCVSLGQVVRVGVYQMDGEESWSCRTCRTLHTYIQLSLLFSGTQNRKSKSVDVNLVFLIAHKKMSGFAFVLECFVVFEN